MKKLWSIFFGSMLSLSVVTTVNAKQVTVQVSDLTFEVAKSILLGQPGGKDFKDLNDDAIRTIIQNRGSFTIDDSVLPTEVRARLDAARKLQEVTSTLQVGRDWADMGRAIGIATREGLNAVTTETAKFAETTPGKFTMFMIAWKVMGTDFLKAIKGYLIGVPLLISWISIFWWWLKTTYRGYWRVETTTSSDGKKTKEKIWVNSIVERLKEKSLNPGEYENFLLFTGVKSLAFVIVGAVIFISI